MYLLEEVIHDIISECSDGRKRLIAKARVQAIKLLPPSEKINNSLNFEPMFTNDITF